MSVVRSVSKWLWGRGKRPAIEEQLTLVPEEDRQRLRAELLRLEEHYRKAFPVVTGYEVLQAMIRGGVL